jgi:hypothetical protein
VNGSSCLIQLLCFSAKVYDLGLLVILLELEFICTCGSSKTHCIFRKYTWFDGTIKWTIFPYHLNVSVYPLPSPLSSLFHQQKLHFFSLNLWRSINPWPLSFLFIINSLLFLVPFYLGLIPCTFFQFIFYKHIQCFKVFSSYSSELQFINKNSTASFKNILEFTD